MSHFFSSFQIAGQRDDLKIIIMSATLDAGKFQQYFRDAPLLVSFQTHGNSFWPLVRCTSPSEFPNTW